MSIKQRRVVDQLAPLPARERQRIMRRVSREEQGGALCEMKLHLRAQMNCTSKEPPWRNQHSPTAGSRASGDRSCYRIGRKRRAVPACSEIGDRKRAGGKHG